MKVIAVIIIVVCIMASTSAATQTGKQKMNSALSYLTAVNHVIAISLNQVMIALKAMVQSLKDKYIQAVVLMMSGISLKRGDYLTRKMSLNLVQVEGEVHLLQVACLPHYHLRHQL